MEFNGESNGCRTGRWLTVCQFRTRDHTTAKTPVNLSRLALEVCRGVEKFVKVSGRAALLRIAALSTVAMQEMEEREKKGRGCTDPRWKVGSGCCLNVDTLMLVSIRRATYGSWEASICML